MKRCFCLLAMLVVSLANAQSTQSPDPNYAAAKDLSGLAGGAADNIKGDPGQYVSRFQGTPTESNTWYGGGVTIPTDQGNSKISNCQSNTADPDLYNRQDCEGINFVGKNKTIRPNVTVDANEPLATGTHKIANDPTDTLNKFHWKIPFDPNGIIPMPPDACQSTDVAIPERSSEENCSVYSGAEFFLCNTLLKVQVVPHFNYSCLETKLKNQNYDCNKTLNVTCETEQNCSEEGVHAGSVNGDMQVSFYKKGAYDELEFGNLNGLYWTGDDAYGQVYERQLTFNIVGKNRLARFMLTWLKFDDWLQIKVNGTRIYASRGDPAWGELTLGRIGYIPMVFIGTHQMGRPEQNGGASVGPNIDLRPYIHEGQNTIETRTIVGGHGNTFLRIETQQQCIPKCIDSWTDSCSQYEQRSQ